MPQTISISTADHYPWGTGCDGWHLVQQPGLSVIQERMQPGTCEERHFHRIARQFFFVLRGQLQLEIDGAVTEVGPDAGVEVPPGAVHEVRNVAPEAVEFLVISQPPSHGDRTPVPGT